MKIINYLSTIAMPMVILIIVIYGVKEKNKVYDNFIEGAKEGLKVVLNIFPTLIGIFVAVGALRASGILDLIINIIQPAINLLKIPAQIMPLAIIRPISGSASMAVATDIISKYGVDSRIGLIAATIMGSTETTFYTIALYTSAVGIKKTRFVLVAALIADIVGMITSVIIWQILSKTFCWHIKENIVIYLQIKSKKEEKQHDIWNTTIFFNIFFYQKNRCENFIKKNSKKNPRKLNILKSIKMKV